MAASPALKAGTSEAMMKKEVDDKEIQVPPTAAPACSHQNGAHRRSQRCGKGL